MSYFDPADLSSIFIIYNEITPLFIITKLNAYPQLNCVGAIRIKSSME